MNRFLDKAVCIAGIACLIGGLLGVGSSIAAAQDIAVAESPLRLVQGQSGDIATRLALDLVVYDRIKSREEVLLHDFVLSDEMRVDVELRRIDVFAEDARIVLGTSEGDVVLPRPDVALFSGQVVGHPDSTVFLSLSPHGSNGLVRLGAETFILATRSRGDDRDTLVYNWTTLPAGTIDWFEFRCGADDLVVPGWNPSASSTARPGDSSARGGAPCRIADLAIETDWEFTGSLFGGDTGASGAYAATLIAADSEIYTRDLNVRLQISYIRLWSSNNDPWNQGNTIDQLFQFQDYWNANMTGIQRHAAHFLSGRGLGGGVAYYPGLCYPEYDYGLSANINGSFPYPIQHNNPQNWDLMVTSHELGHNFGGPHTHDMNPPIDNCASGDCSVVPNGTIMSYCHLCDGGLANVRMEFHPRMISEAILPFLNNDALCDITAAPATITQQPTSQTACLDGSVTFTVVAGGTGPLSYQWRKNGTDIGGATDASYTIDPVGSGDAGDYDVVVSNGCGSATSDIATLTVGAPALGDLNGDCDVDLSDFTTFASCFGGGGVTVPPPGCDQADFANSDLDGDNDVDLSDFVTFAANYTG